MLRARRVPTFYPDASSKVNVPNSKMYFQAVAMCSEFGTGLPLGLDLIFSMTASKNLMESCPVNKRLERLLEGVFTKRVKSLPLSSKAARNPVCRARCPSILRAIIGKTKSSIKGQMSLILWYNSVKESQVVQAECPSILRRFTKRVKELYPKLLRRNSAWTSVPELQGLVCNFGRQTILLRVIYGGLDALLASLLRGFGYNWLKLDVRGVEEENRGQ